MNRFNLKTPQAQGIILGIIILIMAIAFGIPPGFSVALGIIFAAVAYFVLRDSTPGK
jgi:hypothetical protein